MLQHACKSVTILCNESISVTHTCTAMVERDLPGYAIGGLSGGEEKDIFWRIVSLCTDLLPRNKPRYVMGVGWVPTR